MHLHLQLIMHLVVHSRVHLRTPEDSYKVALNDIHIGVQEDTFKVASKISFEAGLKTAQKCEKRCV